MILPKFEISKNRSLVRFFLVNFISFDINTIWKEIYRTTKQPKMTKKPGQLGNQNQHSEKETKRKK